MAVWEEVRHQVAIAGKVVGPGGHGLSHVRISIVDGPDAYLDWLAVKEAIAGDAWSKTAKRPDRVMTEHDGHFHFMDLPDGDYTLHAAFPDNSTRYGAMSMSVSVSRNAQGTISMAQADMTLPATRITGTVLRQGDATPVVMAKVTLQGSFENAFTDEDGDYQLAGIEASPTQNRIVSVSAAGYQDQVLSVPVTAAGVTVTQNITLVPA